MGASTHTYSCTYAPMHPCTQLAVEGYADDSLMGRQQTHTDGSVHCKRKPTANPITTARTLFSCITSAVGLVSAADAATARWGAT